MRINLLSLLSLLSLLFSLNAVGCEVISPWLNDSSFYRPPPPSSSNDEPSSNPVPEPCGLVGNPISVYTGNKFQIEEDLPFAKHNALGLYRTYNSHDGVWRHNYSAALLIGDTTITYAAVDGSRHVFLKKSLQRYSTAVGSLIRNGAGWIYESDEVGRLEFDSIGRLIAVKNISGQRVTLSYSAPGIIVINTPTGQSLTLQEDAFRLLRSARMGGRVIEYAYNSKGMLVSVSSLGKTRKYLYEDERASWLLTGIIDEIGNRYAIWKYDSSLRAISSEHNGGADKTTLQFMNENTTIVTNALGKKTRYVHGVSGGYRRLKQVIGEPTPNCPYSNSSFEYDKYGNLTKKTDAKGIFTTYKYNGSNKLVSVIEAAGTSSARETLYEWHPVFNKVSKISNALSVITFAYDNSGRLISRQLVSK